MRYLLTFSIGPVQDFIAASRRTADLKAGSDLLVKIAKTVAESLTHQGAALIFPADEDTEPSNKLLCIVESDPAPVVEAAKKAAQDVINRRWEEMIANLPPGVKNTLRADLAQSQIEHFLEFYAAWVPLNASYTDARRDVERLLAGRKALREFEQPKSDKQIPKSPLDPSRDCVLEVDKGFQVAKKSQGHPLWLKPRETLDAVSVLKRWIGYEETENKSDDVPSSSLMAAQSILPIARDKAKEKENVREALRGLDDVVADTPAGIDLGDLMFQNRLDEAIRELEEQQDKMSELAKQHTLTLIRYHNDRTISGWRKTVLDVVGRKECPPYYAILIADGDQMGKLLSQMDSEEKHREFSRKVANFSSLVKDIVKKHYGYLVYHGGDDVLAFLPVNGALPCAEKLKNKFYEIVGGTLSADIAIVHHMDNLQMCLEWARNAEREAKKERNSVAVALHTRGGESMTVATTWQDYETWGTWRNVFQTNAKDLARGFPYELREMARDFHGTELQNDSKLLMDEAIRILERKEGGRSHIDHLKQMAFASAKDVEQFSKLLVIARFLATYPELPIGGAQ